MTKEQLATWVAGAKTRKGLPFTVATFEQDVQDNVTTMSGTITLAPAVPEVIATPGHAGVPAKSADVIDMVWNTSGKALSNNIGYDLVHVVNFADITPSV